ncbi:putative bifunctional diguanylate cyclase/phosphodiesterase [Acidovorax sp. RAC01]|uniref:putative bifunctional diguanylate cyclase/phosphodiesterase n=1 Tax=Acidovorax sp. RAC01 TaxID=1842533 RepID=UPI00083E740B|nr:GGDEF and EAL domain-containing protein [Acidovorax sp. RAC01]AOG22091.1 diguanylate cyclase domain protein [Acidovorax sp. RAC01]
MTDFPLLGDTASTEASGDGLLGAIADALPALIAYYSVPDLRCRYANQAYAAYTGHTPASIVGLPVHETLGDVTWEGIRHDVERAMRGQRVKYHREHTLHTGETRLFEVQLIPHLDRATRVQRGCHIFISDITERWKAERTMRESEERMRKFSEATQEAIVFHHEGVITDGNEALIRLTGYPLHEIVGQSIFSYISPEWRALAIEYTRAGREHPYEVTVRHRDGHIIPVEVAGKTLPTERAGYRIVVVRDITARKQAQAREAFMALHDPLTQLPNRHFLMEQLTQVLALARRREGRAAVLFLNLDHFKTVNDSLGHQAGDRLLCDVADRLRAGVRDADIVARVGGDEFVVVLTDVPDAQGAAAVADQLLAAMNALFMLDQIPLALSHSIGISLYPDHAGSAETLLRCADAAMQHAKDSGRGHRQFYDASMDGGALDVLHKERLLRKAIAESGFVLHYQPQVRLQDGSLQGLEALVRWVHPERGLVGPGEFIEFAESRGLIAHIGRWVMCEACRQLKGWQDLGLALVPVAINLSAIEFRQRDVAAEIAAVLQETGLEPRYLEIELTESVLMHHTGQVLDTLMALKALGVGVSIDDFGTGYSSLAYLKRYPIDKLKIDRSFVMDTPDNADDVAIVTAIIQMAHNLQLKTVAEGVETGPQMELLGRLGCESIQGYLVARPMAADAALQWLRKGAGQ